MYLSKSRLTTVFRRAGGLATASAILASVLAMTASPIGTASAAVGPCRSDPVVTLSNLKVLDLSATIGTDQANLNSVSYVLHLPPGVFPLLVVPTDGLVGQVEHFSYVNDAPWGVYVDTTTASTTSAVPVTATAFNLLIGSGSSSGYSNSPVSVRF